MTNPKDHLVTIRGLAVRLSACKPSTNRDIAGLGFMAGALHGLERAAALGYEDSRSQPVPAQFAREFIDALTANGRGAPPSAIWESGFFFNSAIMRLAALNERIAGSNDVAPNIRRSVNLLKHRADAHISGERPISFDEAVTAATDLCALLAATM
jgi:hypothetical protein